MKVEMNTKLGVGPSKVAASTPRNSCGYTSKFYKCDTEI